MQTTVKAVLWGRGLNLDYRDTDGRKPKNFVKEQDAQKVGFQFKMSYSVQGETQLHSNKVASSHTAIPTR